jgi:FAD/FMN-containing dehydrogenase
MDRRRFVAAAGSAGLLGLSACGGSDDGAVPVPPPAPPPAPAPAPAPDWAALAGTLSGSVLLPGADAYATAAPVFNAVYDATMPQAVVRCATTDDVVLALGFARRNGLAVAPRSGGHGYTGNSTTRGVVIDVGALSTIVEGTGTATIGAGAKLVDIYDQLSTQGVCIPSGICPTIGIAGITLGGGIGKVDRAVGLTCDSLVSAQVVLADGSLVTCDANDHADLFWALRGGGGGNFGIVTSMTFATFATQDVVSFSAAFAWADAAAVLAAWQAWPQVLPDTLWASVLMSPAPAIQVSGLFLGSQSDFTPLWTQFLAAAAATPTTQQIQPQSFRDAMLAPCYRRTVSQCHLAGETIDGMVARAAFAATSDFFDAALPPAGIQALLAATTAQPGSGLLVLLDLMGGAIARVAPDATAFVHRNALFSAQYYVQQPLGASDAALAQARSVASGLRAAMSPWSSGRAYQNYLDPDLAGWEAAYYGANYARLVQVKAIYDPTQVFRPLQGIPPQ